MKIYRIETTSDGNESSGYIYFSTLLKAKNWLKKEQQQDLYEDFWFKDESSIEEIEFSLSKKGIIGMMTQFASYPNND